MSELTLVLIGDTSSTETGSKNFLLDHEVETNMPHFSSRLYDLCGRFISVINLLGLKNMDKFPINQGIHAFLLLLPNGQHNSHFSSGVQWLEKMFGQKSLDYLMIVLTHELNENYQKALTELKANSRFVDKRYHTCSRSMMDENEIIALLDKIDVMVSENDPQNYTRPEADENEEQEQQMDQKSHEEEQKDSSVFEQSQIGEILMLGILDYTQTHSFIKNNTEAQSLALVH